VLTGGGWLLGDGLRTVVRHLGISQTLLGNTALAATVEAEELARIVVPARGRPELALGNIAGTIVHFASFNAGIIAVVTPLTLDHDTTTLYLPAAAASPAILAALPLVRGRLGRAEGVALMALYACVRDLDTACSTMQLIGVDTDLARTAGDLAERHALRGYDAVHLATALSVDDSELVPLVPPRRRSVGRIIRYFGDVCAGQTPHGTRHVGGCVREAALADRGTWPGTRAEGPFPWQRRPLPEDARFSRSRRGVR
jgi:predicted nucleic acid-binding protein